MAGVNATHEMHLTTEELAVRLRLAESTLKNWRVSGEGPRYLKFGRKVLYPMSEVEAFEARCLQIATHVKVTEG